MPENNEPVDVVLEVNEYLVVGPKAQTTTGQLLGQDTLAGVVRSMYGEAEYTFDITGYKPEGPWTAKVGYRELRDPQRQWEDDIEMKGRFGRGSATLVGHIFIKLHVAPRLVRRETYQTLTIDRVRHGFADVGRSGSRRVSVPVAHWWESVPQA